MTTQFPLRKQQFRQSDLSSKDRTKDNWYIYMLRIIKGIIQQMSGTINSFFCWFLICSQFLNYCQITTFTLEAAMRAKVSQLQRLHQRNMIRQIVQNKKGNDSRHNWYFEADYKFSKILLTCNDNAISTSEAAIQAIGSQLRRQDKRQLIHLHAQNNQGNYSTNAWLGSRSWTWLYHKNLCQERYIARNINRSK